MPSKAQKVGIIAASRATPQPCLYVSISGYTYIYIILDSSVIKVYRDPVHADSCRVQISQVASFSPLANSLDQ